MIVIGAGPAGITASVYAARKMMNFIVLTGDIGGQAAWSSDIENYTGYQVVSGPELAARFEEHMRKYNFGIHESEEVLELRKDAGIVLVRTAKNTYRAKTLIIASGKRSKELGVPGEKEFKNKGLTYCATCDGPLFADKDVAVIGGGNSALDAIVQMSRIARHVFVINIDKDLGGEEIVRKKVQEDKKVTILNESRVTKISGASFLESIEIESNGKKDNISVGGVFVEIGLIPNSEFAGIVDKNKSGEIKVNSFSETNIPGIFAAGDVTDVPEKQIIIAAGDGAKAALGAFKFLSRQA